VLSIQSVCWWNITAAGGQAIVVVCDIADAEQIIAAVEKVVATFGQIDVLVNNAFDRSVAVSSIAELSVKQLQRNFDTGPILFADNAGLLSCA
jgi:3-oxoacyl-[acyl-carrier protein] reductase